MYVVESNNTRFSDSFGFEHIPKEIKKFIRNEISTTIFLEYKHVIQ